MNHRVKTRDGIEVAFELRERPASEEALILCPGFFQSRKTPTFRRMAEALARNWNVVPIDFRGHGDSGGLFTFSAREEADLEAALGWAAERFPRVAILGFSLGAATAINVVSRRGGVRSLIAVSSPSAFEEIEFKFWTPEAIRTGLRGLEAGAGCRPGSPWLSKRRPVDSIRKITRVPILFIHGTKDQIVGFSHSERLYQNASGKKRLERMEGGGHAEEIYRKEPERFLALVQEWLAATLTEDKEGGADE